MTGSTVLLLAMLQILAHSQEIGRTVSGFVHGPDRALRPILGVPGSAWLGPPVMEQLDRAWVAPSGRWAVGTVNGITIILRDLDQLKGRPETDERLLAGIDRVVWSPDGVMACLFSAASGRIQRIRVGGDSVVVEPPVELIAAGGEMAAIVIGESGRIALAITGRGVYVSRADSALDLAVTVEKISALAFLPGDRTLLAADEDTGSILSVDLFVTPAAVRTLVTECRGVASLTIAAQQIHVVTASPASVRTFGTDGSPRSELFLGRAPGQVQTLRSTLLLLNAPEGSAPATVLNLRPTPTLFFVPAPDVTQL